MGKENGAMEGPHGLLEPLPPLTLVESVQKLDAGLRSLDHCKEPSDFLCVKADTDIDCR